MAFESPHCDPVLRDLGVNLADVNEAAEDYATPAETRAFKEGVIFGAITTIENQASGS